MSKSAGEVFQPLRLGILREFVEEKIKQYPKLKDSILNLYEIAEINLSIFQDERLEIFLCIEEINKLIKDVN